ncbi:uncharacterized protein LOC143431477 [Xylocopa sonorina]|uniref:uncharacterized protein LOC143431477 n=1 Tax=Xylocopa sonorina TaxID=1818115 RepID=UPI00403AF25F
MEYSVFRDYCKAENSEDEEVNDDLQSRLYAEIYYASNETKNVDTKSNIKLETNTVDNQLGKNAIASKTSDFNDASVRSNSSSDCRKTSTSNESADNSALIEKNSRSDGKSIYTLKETESCKNTRNKDDFNSPHKKVLRKPEENIEYSKNNKQLTMCHNVEGSKNVFDCHSTSVIEEDVKPEVKSNIVEESKSLQHKNNETKTATEYSNQNFTMHNIDNKNRKYQEAVCNEANVNSIFKKYEFSKSLINKLYREKYENLKKKLEEIEEEKENNLTQRGQAGVNIERNDGNQLQQKSDKYMEPANEVETDTRYKILSRAEKMQKVASCEEITVISSESESDSEESILEVPIPPKPQPPVINLQDSEASDDDTDTNQECSFIIESENELVKKAKKKSSKANKDSSNAVPAVDPNNDASLVEDIMLNCTQVQKGASSLNEIMEMSKTVQSQQCLDKDTRPCTKHKSVIESETPTESVSKSSKQLLSTKHKDNTSESQLPPKTVTNSNVVYERDKNDSIDFTEDVTDIMNFHEPIEIYPSRKRCRENDDEPSTSVNQASDIVNESKRSKTSNEQCKDKGKPGQDSWEEYFFRPASENLKAFYNETSGHENFDFREMQKKMSKDPRLWAILDEDLMPDLAKRHRYWNIKCNNCHQQGHQRHNCPEPYKPVRCHMCGTQGHTETRCPQKMCLTCGRKQGTFRKTCEICSTLYCQTCNAIGHKSIECPDLWRRFHQTTRTSEINIPDNLLEVMKPADLLYCCNCTKRGHDSSTCNEYRWSQHFPTPAFVSDYVGGPEYEVPINATEDVIPLTRKKKKRNTTFLEGEDDLDSSAVIYSYGTFFTKKADTGQEITRKLNNDQIRHRLTHLIKGRISPTFLDHLTKLIKFEIRIYYDSRKELMIRVRSITKCTQHLTEIFVFWLKLEAEDEHLDIYVNLPRGTRKMYKLLTEKVKELDKSFPDPNSLCKKINRLRAETSGSVSQALVSLQSTLLKQYHTKPTFSKQVRKLKRVMNVLQNSPLSEIAIAQYLNIIVLYNKVFLPRTLTSIELKNFLREYYKPVKNVPYKEKENKKTKKQKKQESNAFKKFIIDLQKFNNTRLTKNKCKETSNNEACSSKDVQTQDKPVSTYVPVMEKDQVNSNQTDVQAVTYNAENVFTEALNVESNVTESASTCFHQDLYPINSMELQCDQSIVHNNEMTNAVQYYPETFTEPTYANAPSEVDPNLSCSTVTIPPESNTKKPKTVNLNNLIVIDTNNLQQEQHQEQRQEQDNNTISTQSSTTKKKKSKKAKKAKQDPQDSSKVSANQVTAHTDASIEITANRIINEALQFNTPYMNKAVEEVRKRIEDKNLKQEHINTLQRLINLENDHRKYVSSFCNYLH